jgi:endonuclease I
MLRLLLLLVFTAVSFSGGRLEIFRDLYKLEDQGLNFPEAYKSLEGMEGQELFNALHEQIGKNFSMHEYREAKHFMYHYVDNRDNQVYTIYSGLFAEKQGKRFKEYGDANGDGTGGDFVNCEHVWPQSKFDKVIPMVSDLHHLYPSFSKPNGMRSSWPFGYVDDEDVTYSTTLGSKLGYDVYEPADKSKGNIARAMLYFYLRYHNKDIFRKTDKDEFWNSRISMFLDWNRQDPPDPWERSRNGAIEKYQGNRNPFIDFPQFAELIGEEPFKATGKQIPSESEETEEQTPSTENTNAYKGLSGKALLQELNRVTGKGFKAHGYKEAKSYMYHYIDERGKDKVYALYSDLIGYKTDKHKFLEEGDANGDGVGGDFVNCEHVWPQSKFDKKVPMVSDIHHLYPTFSKPNGMRSSWPFGEVDRVKYSTDAGSKLGYNNEFEPADHAKGNIARAMLYFYTRYFNRSIWKKTNRNAFWNSKIQQFLNWNKMDPPDASEKERNDRIEDFQGNRNPFIDQPELADRIGVDAFRAK